jgi:hypothetical protein
VAEIHSYEVVAFEVKPAIFQRFGDDEPVGDLTGHQLGPNGTKVWARPKDLHAGAEPYLLR